MRRAIPALLIVALFVFIVVLLARSPKEQPTEAPKAVETSETTSTPPVVASSTPLELPKKVTREELSPQATSTPTTTSTPTPPPPPAPTRIAFTISADDSSFSPSEIRVQRGATVSITFRVSATNVYYGGLEIRSSAFNTSTIPPGGMKTVSFIANSTFDFSSYWPLSNVLKTTGRVIVE